MGRTQTRLFHLHFNTPNVDTAATRLAALGVPCERRFGSIRGENTSLAPDEPGPEEFRFKLQVHRTGAVDVTLAPGRRPRFDHLGVVVEDAAAVFDRALEREWPVRENPRRSFVMTPWGFRVEVHGRDNEAVAELGAGEDGHLASVTLEVPDADAPGTFREVFGRAPDLELERGDEVRAVSFDIAGDAVTDGRVDVADLLAA